MFAVPKNIITKITLIASLLLPGLAQADAQTCFNFLNAQDYARATSEAQQVLRGGNLNLVDERDAQLCLGRAYDNRGRAVLIAVMASILDPEALKLFDAAGLIPSQLDKVLI